MTFPSPPRQVVPRNPQVLAPFKGMKRSAPEITTPSPYGLSSPRQSSASAFPRLRVARFLEYTKQKENGHFFHPKYHQFLRVLEEEPKNLKIHNFNLHSIAPFSGSTTQRPLSGWASLSGPLKSSRSQYSTRRRPPSPHELPPRPREAAGVGGLGTLPGRLDGADCPTPSRVWAAHTREGVACAIAKTRSGCGARAVTSLP